MDLSGMADCVRLAIWWTAATEKVRSAVWWVLVAVATVAGIGLLVSVGVEVGAALA